MPVLVYHRVCEVPPEADVDYLNVAPKSFAQQLDFLVRNGYEVLTADELISRLARRDRLPRRAVCITFDDGYRNNYVFAFPELQARGFRATFYLATSLIDSGVRFPWLRSDSALQEAELQSPDVSCPLTWSEVRKMEAAGMLIGSHSATHPDFARLSEAQIIAEIETSRTALSSNVSQVADSFVCPFGVTGASARRVREIVRKGGYAGAFLGRMGCTHMNADPFDLPRITVYGSDSLKVFARKLEGAYDWLAVLLPFWWKIAGS